MKLFNHLQRSTFFIGTLLQHKECFLLYLVLVINETVPQERDEDDDIKSS